MTARSLVEIDTCQVCGSRDSDVCFEEPPFRVRRCRRCALVWVSPRVHDDDVAGVYGERYWRSDRPREQGYADYVSDEPLYLKTFRRRLALVRRFCRPGSRVLDVGCAAGYFLRVMKGEGHEVRGVELSPAIAAHAKQRLGDESVWVGRLEDVPADRPGFERGSFDLVTMWDVVEHVPDPQSLLREAHTMLAPGGVLILETQNVDSTFARTLGRRWHHYKHEEHLYHFNPETVRQLLQQSGFEVVRNSPAFGGKYVSLGFIAERAARLHRLLSIALRPLSLLRNANFYVNLRDEMVVVAKPVATPVPAAAGAG